MNASFFRQPSVHWSCYVLLFADFVNFLDTFLLIYFSIDLCFVCLLCTAGSLRQPYQRPVRDDVRIGVDAELRGAINLESGSPGGVVERSDAQLGQHRGSFRVQQAYNVEFVEQFGQWETPAERQRRYFSLYSYLFIYYYARSNQLIIKREIETNTLFRLYVAGFLVLINILSNKY